MERAKAGFSPDRGLAPADEVATGTFPSGGEPSPGQAAFAKHTSQMMDVVIGVIDRSLSRQRVLDELRFDLRECGERIQQTGFTISERIKADWSIGPTLCRQCATRMERAIEFGSISEDDLEDMEEDERAETIAERDRLLAAMVRDGVDAVSMRIAANAFRVAATKLETH